MTAEVSAAAPSLRRQLLWWLVPPVLIVVVLSSFVSYRIALSYANEAYDFNLFDAAKSLAEQLTFGRDGQPVLNLPPAAEEIIRSDPVDRVFYRVIAANGNTIAGRADLALPAVRPEREMPTQFYDAEILDVAVRACAHTVFNDRKEPVATVLVAETLLKRDRLSRSLLVTDIVLPLVLLPGLMGVIVWYGIGRGLRSLRQLSVALERRGWSDMTPIGSHDTPREAKPLTNAIDSLMQRLGHAHAAQKRFIEEAAHQMRTPLAGLIAQTDRAMQASDANGVRSALEQLYRSSQRVTRLVNQLLSFAQVEPGGAPAMDFAPLDLGALVQATCTEWVPEALRNHVDLGYEGTPGPVTIRGSALLLSEMLNNLIDNALRYGARPGVVTVRLEASPQLQLSVEDDGPGIPEEERERVFERFHRLPGARPGGSGLGLAIVREIARAHGASVIALPRAGGGTAICVTFANGS